MGIEQRIRELEEIQRPFSQSFPVIKGNAYLIDNTFAFAITDLHVSGQLAAAFVADMQLPIIREHAKKDRESYRTGIGQLIIKFRPGQRVVYLGDKYKFSLSKDRDSFQLQSTSPIDFQPVSKDPNLKALVAQRTSRTNI